MASLDRDLRRDLENAVKKARRVADDGARQAVEQLAVGHHEPWSALSPDQRKLRNRLRAHGRQLGDKLDEKKGTQNIDRLTGECAYEHWHRLLFARFLAENDLLVEPESGMALSLDECRELAREQSKDWLVIASDFAQRMLPQIFRAGDPVLEVALPPEKRQELEAILEGLPREIFVADDSLGWVYQFWQAEQKDVVNASEHKIGADELPAVTQLFTEDYMVLFLLHNTLGAWWAGKVLAANFDLARSAASEHELRVACAVQGIDWSYLRFMREGDVWRPAAGTFPDWPTAAKSITVLDPCMGSGHFLVFALPMLAAIRVAEEGLALDTAIEAVLRDNLFGLEIDPRCTQIAAFNLALAAWRRLGYRRLPALHLACSGLSLGLSKTEWLKLAERAAQELSAPPKRASLGTEDNSFSDAAKRGFERLYDLFGRAPWLGSLIDPAAAGGDLIEHGFADLEPLLARVMTKAETAEVAEMAVAAQGLAKAAQLLAGRYTLVTTNVPYLGRSKQDDVLKDYCERRYPNARADLATCFLERCIKFAGQAGTVSLVTPHGWLYLDRYEPLRRAFLQEFEWCLLGRLGARAFETISGEIVNVSLICLNSRSPRDGTNFFGMDVSGGKDVTGKALRLLSDAGRLLNQRGQLENPDARLVLCGDDEGAEIATPLAHFAECYQGLRTGDANRFIRCYWEVPVSGAEWEFFQSTSEESSSLIAGLSYAIFWQSGRGELHEYAQQTRDKLHDMHESGNRSWGKLGVAVGQVTLRPTRYFGQKFDNTLAVITPLDERYLPAITAYCSSNEYVERVRAIAHGLYVTNQALVKVPFNAERWNELAEQSFPGGLPAPRSDDPTQWLFHGHAKDSTAPLHVAAARLVGYLWPRQTGSSFHDCPALESDGLEKHGDRDGIVTLSSVKGEQPAAERLTDLLSDAFGCEWSAMKLDKLLAEVGFAGRTITDWLRDGFFQQHCDLFHQRPFVWHVWDGRRDGFHALIDYHRLAGSNGEGRRTLEKLLYSYLGDWIERQRRDQKAGVEGADGRVAAAEHLKRELEKILHGEPPYDIFVRWKPLHQQPIGWDPDIDDGVRANIRPFMTAKPLNARGKNACILRVAPKIKWDKDRGKEPTREKADFPWFWGWEGSTQNFAGGNEFDGNRWNDLHYSCSVKLAARERAKGGRS
jgi:hypothetical protein